MDFNIDMKFITDTVDYVLVFLCVWFWLE